MTPTMTLSDQKHIVISGGARGIGRVLARHFLSKNHLVFILDIDETELIHTATKDLAEYSSNLGYTTCNVRNISDIRPTVQKALYFFPWPRIDVLINNAGIARPHWADGKTMADPETLDQWTAYIETNLTAPFALSQACIPYMKVSDSKGPRDPRCPANLSPCIIHISSFRAYQSDPDQEGYASAKAGLLGLTHSMAVSCARWGIRVNAIAPGWIKTKHEAKKGDEEGKDWDVTEDDVAKHPANRAGRPEDIAQAAEYFINATFTTGQDLVVDGGAGKVMASA